MKTILVDAIYAFILADGTIFQPLHDLLETFANPKILLTGASGLRFKEFGLDKSPYEVFTLSHNPDKTDPKYYEMMLKHFDLKADEVVYFEHNSDAVKSAESVGIKTFYYDPDKKDVAALGQWLKDNLSVA